LLSRLNNSLTAAAAVKSSLQRYRSKKGEKKKKEKPLTNDFNQNSVGFSLKQRSEMMTGLMMSPCQSVCLSVHRQVKTVKD